MPEDIEVPAVGKVKREYVLAGVALTVGIVGAVWYRSRAGGGGQAPAIDPNELVGADREPMDPGAGAGSVDSTDPSVPRNNAEWTRAATEYMSNFGWEPSLVGIALGKYLGRQRLSTTEADAVRTAVGAFGPPPDGGPYEILRDLPAAEQPRDTRRYQIKVTEQPSGTVRKGSTVTFRGLVLETGGTRSGHANTPVPAHKFIRVRQREKSTEGFSTIAGVHSGNDGRWTYRAKATTNREYAFQIPADFGQPGTPTDYAKVKVK